MTVAPSIASFSDTEFSNYHCTSEWHLAKMGPCARIIYPFALYISKNSRSFYCSALNLADYFRCDESTIRRGFKQLCNSGFFQEICAEPFSPTQYRPISHEEWALNNPNKCVVRSELPWSQGDALGKHLYSLSGAKVLFRPNQIGAMRSVGYSDAEIEKHFAEYWGKHNLPHRNRKCIPGKFINWLRSHRRAETTLHQQQSISNSGQGRPPIGVDYVPSIDGHSCSLAAGEYARQVSEV